jgi:CelD/BcsL family acetyltransferase involved in cellulose biosynthesis
VPAGSGWADRLRAAWPGAFVHVRPMGAAPVAPVEAADADAWLKSRSSNFRQQMRRFRRRLDEAGATWRATEDASALESDIATLEQLHRGRLERTDAFPPGAAAMLADAGRELMPAGRFRLALIEVDGRAVNAQLFVGAGDELSYWNGGFDDEYGQLRPSYVGLVDGVAAAIDGGYARFDLGQGTQPYKSRFADDEVALETVTLIPPGPRKLAGRVAYAPVQLRHAVASRLSDERKEWLKSRLPGRRAEADAG